MLRLVEAMDLVDEQDGRARAALAFAGFFDGGPDIFHAGEDGGDRDEFGVLMCGDQAREGGLAGAGRTPEDERRELALAANGRSQQRFLADHCRLADEFVEAAGRMRSARGASGAASGGSSGSSNRLAVASRGMRGGLVRGSAASACGVSESR